MDYQPSSDDLYEGLLSHLPEPNARCLDVGCGSGWDSKWMANKGYKVVAVDRELPVGLPESISCYKDTLPCLNRLDNAPNFDFILCACVWMFIPIKERQRAGNRLISLLSPYGRLAIITKDTDLAPLPHPLIDFYTNRDLSGRDITWLTYVYASERPSSQA